MSRVTFHSVDGEAELRGSERAYAGGITGDMALSVLRGSFRGRERYGRLVPADHYLHSTKDEFWMDSFKTWWSVGFDTHEFDFDGYRITPWQVSLNTALVMGSDVIELLARIHATCEIHGSGQDSIPHFIDFLLKGREEWEREYRPRLDPDDPRRLPSGPDWEREKQALNSRDYPVGIGIGSLYGWMRDWMGFERAAMMVYDDPGLVEEIMETITRTVVRTIEWAGPQVEIDFGGGWEDMAFRNGPMISPATFEKLMVPRYRRICDALHKHGCDIIYTDCDGNINALVPLWLEAGVNCMFPVEVAAGTDPLALRDRFGKQILLIGGVNKRALAQGKGAIRTELARIAPGVREGGWIPHVDHRVPPDVTFENYLYYLAAKRDAFGIPEPAPWAQRRPADWGPGE